MTWVVTSCRLLCARQILVAEVENLTHDAFEQTDEIKALCNEIVQTIREIMMTSPVYK